MSSPVVLITGALTGIGRATAVAFAEDGARVVASGRREAEGKALEAELRSLGAEAAFIRADVRREDDVSSLIDETVARFGRIDAAVNAAGTEGRPGPVTEQTAESYAATFDTNVLGTLLSMKHELRVMQAQNSGSIINISSTYGHEGGAGASVYAGSKHATRSTSRVPPSFSLPKKHHSSQDTYLPSTEARPPAEGNSSSRFIDGDCARESTITTQTRSTRNTYKWREGVRWPTWSRNTVFLPN
jgi:nucleoside-diphosphate-sugar epimerase